MEILESRGYTVYFPQTGIIEVVATLKRGGLNKQAITGIVKSIEETFVVISEDIIYSKAFKVALERTPTGFNTYFIALATATNSMLTIDGKLTANHARALGIETILIREAGLEQIQKKTHKIAEISMSTYATIP